VFRRDVIPKPKWLMYMGQAVPSLSLGITKNNISATPPRHAGFVDSVIVVDDGSTDATVERVRAFSAQEKRVSLLLNEGNQGKGTAVVRGCREAISRGAAIVALMDGDHQMPAQHLGELLDPLVQDGYDASKGNRFIGLAGGLSAMPKYRLVGNILLTMLTKLASGYWSLFDSQNGYWAFRHTYSPRPGQIGPALRFREQPSDKPERHPRANQGCWDPARYADEESKIRLWRDMPRILATLRWLRRRIFYRYVIYNFHPVALFLFAGLFLLVVGTGFGIKAVADSLGEPAATTGTVMLAVLPLLVGAQLLLAALVLDILSEPK
jgi:glycosyltransferase involved in cell wall biosynthesis